MDFITTMLADSDDIEEVIDALHTARDALVQAARDYANDALSYAEDAIQKAVDGVMCAELYVPVVEARERRDRAMDAVDSTLALTDMICITRETGDMYADAAFTKFQMNHIRVDTIYAIIAAVDSRMEAVMGMMPDNAVPGARCAKLTPKPNERPPEEAA